MTLKKVGCLLLMLLLVMSVGSNALRPLGALNSLLGASKVDTTPEAVKTFLQQKQVYAYNDQIQDASGSGGNGEGSSAATTDDLV